MNKKRVIAFFLVLLLLILGDVYFEVNNPKVNFIKIQTNKFTSRVQFKILQISDMHNKQFHNNNKDLLKVIKELEPDIIVITGDLIDRNTVSPDKAYLFMEELIKIKQKVFFVSGNHERYNKNIQSFSKGLSKRGVTVLNNSNIFYPFKGTSINICGVDDPYSGYADLSLAFKGVNSDFFTVLLAHDPDIITNNILPADLILSGHTHGGQVRFPLIGGLVAPGQGLFPKLQKGIYNLDSGKILYIDSGLGTSVFPIRFLNRSQLSLITIE